MSRPLRPFVLVGLAFLGGALSSTELGLARDGGEDTYRKLAVFARVLSYVENNYVDEVPVERLVYGAIRGMLATLDPHSAFLDPKQFALMKGDSKGEFGGIGIEVVHRDGRFVVLELHPGTPAARGGLALVFTRERIVVPSVLHHAERGGLGYLRIRSFTERTIQEVEAALVELNE